MPTLATGLGPRPSGTRYVFGYDELRWSGATSLGDLLMQIPGVMQVRSGSFGQPETVSYAGQGAASLEIYRDGFQLDPLGEDSVSFDTGRFEIGQFRRIEVEVLPTVLRVHLISDTQTALRARTEASFATGDASTNAYRVRYLNRWRSGAGISIGASYLGTQGPTSSPAKSNALWISGKLTVMPTQRLGVELQFNTYTLDAEAITPLGGGVVLRARKIRRGDLFVRAFSSTRGDGMGLRFDALVGSSSYGDTTHALDRHVGQAAVSLGYGASRWSAEGWARIRDNIAPLDVGGRASISPLRFVTLSGYGRMRTLLGGGGMREGAGSAELRLVPWAALHGDVRWRHLEDSLFVASDTAETVLDWSAGLGVTGSLLSFDVSMTRRGDFSAPAFGLFRRQVPLMMTAGASAPQISYRFQPRSWFSISGWIRMPSTDSVPYDPPTHSVTRFTFRSQFLPKLRRGVFDLETMVEVEAWGSGVMGRDSAGTPIRLVGHTTFSFMIQVRLVGALIYWSMHNTQFERYQLLPGYFQPRAVQRFGLRWEFTN